MIANLLDGIEVRLNTDYLKNKDELDALTDKVVYTGPIDAYFDYQLGTLEYRSVRFETETLDKPNFQGNAAVNYTDHETPWTRIIEHKWFEFGKDENGNDQNQKNNRRNFRQGRVQDLLKGGFGKLRCHDEDNGRNGKPGEIFDSSVPIRMVGVCFLSAHLKSDQRNDRRTGIRQVVECVRSDCNGMADHTGDDF